MLLLRLKHKPLTLTELKDEAEIEEGEVDCAASVLCMADVEALYTISYIQGHSYTVHMGDRDLVFYQKSKIYVGDFSDWVTPTAYSMMTLSEREALYSKKEIERAKKAREFVINAGFPSERKAINMIRDGNVSNLPIEVSDVKAFFDIYGPLVQSIRGKTTSSKDVNQRDNFDEGLKEQRTIQALASDVMFIAKAKFLVSVASPLEITITAPLTSQTKLGLGKGLQEYLDLIRIFGFNARIVYVDPLKALTSLRGSFPGVKVDISGAGDHLPKVDIRIRRIKEIIRSVIQDLDWTLPKALLGYLVTYAVNRMNTRRITASTSNLAPRVKLTGRKIEYN